MKLFENIPTFRKIPHSPVLFIWEALSGARKWFVTTLVLAFFLQLMKVYVPVFFSEMVNYFAAISPEDVSTSKVGRFLAAILCAYLAQIILRMINELINENFVRNYATAKIELFAVDYLANHSEKYFAAQKTGELAQKITNCAEKTSQALFVFAQLRSNVLMVCINFFFIGRVNAWFLVLILIFGSFSILRTYQASFAVRDLNEKYSNALDDFNGTLADSISNALNVKATGAQDIEVRYVTKIFHKLKDTRFAMLEKMQDVLRVQNFMLCLFQTAVFVMLLRLWYQKQINIGDVTLVLMLVNSVTHCFTQILAKVCDLNSLSGALEAAMLPLTVKHDIKNAHGAKKLKIKNQEIVFDHVGFAYDNKTVFKNLSFVIKKHEKIGIVGLSGSGKTTLINLLQRAYDVSQGKIYIDGQDIARVTLHSLHNAIAIIPQDTSLFHRTIAQNIAYGRLNASMADIKKAAVKAWADEFIRDLPQGYQTKVGEKGVKLSGGERQRIAIARAIVKNSPILILDEATSSLDSKTEKYIQRAMKNLMKGKTVIAAAHRLSTLKEMDRIIVLNNGCIAEQGTIAELLALNGLFKNFWDIQSKKTPA